ncbi:hypothetical protein [Methanobrevibacter sp.]|uniref:hypothetical protein n=1 Tax=Methanobrevibacter sp. TaxID=66852 RepID=UPI00388F81DC
MLNKKIIFVFLFLSIITLTSVSAAELNETDLENPIDDDPLSVDKSNEIISDSSSTYTRNDMKCELSQTGYYYGQTKLHLSLTNTTTKAPISDKAVGIYVDDELWKEFTTNSKGLIDTDLKLSPGSYLLEAKLTESDIVIGQLHFTIQKIPTSFGVKQTSAYYKDSKLTFQLNNMLTKKGLANQKISVKFSNGKKVTLKTNSKGTVSYNVPFKPGKYSMTATTQSGSIAKNTVSLKKFQIGKTYLKIKAGKLSTTYNSGKTLNVKVTNYFTNHALKGIKLSLKVYTGKKYKTVKITTNSAGVAKYDPSSLKIGTHKVIIKTADRYTDDLGQKTTSIKLSKAKLSIQAPKITTDVNTTKTLKITVKNKETQKAMKNVKVTVKVYTGKQFKTFNLKTNANGQVTVSSASLSNCTHDVVISVKGDSKIAKASAKSSITVLETES